MTNQIPASGTPYAPPNSSLALISLIMGILGLTILPFLGSIVAVITAPMAKKEIRSSMGTLGGEGMATAGAILGWIGVAMGLIGGCVAVVAFLLSGLLVYLGLSAESQSLSPVLSILI